MFLASQYLKKRITLIQFLEGEREDQSFFPNREAFLARDSEESKV